MTSVRHGRKQKLLADPQIGRALLDESRGDHDFLDRHHDRELGDQFVAAQAAAIDSDVAVPGALALHDAVDEVLRYPEEIGHSHFAHDCFCPSQRNNHFGMPKTECKLNIGFLTYIRQNIYARCSVLEPQQLSENSTTPVPPGATPAPNCSANAAFSSHPLRETSTRADETAVATFWVALTRPLFSFTEPPAGPPAPARSRRARARSSRLQAFVCLQKHSGRPARGQRAKSAALSDGAVAIQMGVS
jgi:hypothetical protein